MSDYFSFCDRLADIGSTENLEINHAYTTKALASMTPAGLLARPINTSVSITYGASWNADNT